MSSVEAKPKTVARVHARDPYETLIGIIVKHKDGTYELRLHYPPSINGEYHQLHPYPSYETAVYHASTITGGNLVIYEECT